MSRLRVAAVMGLGLALTACGDATPTAVEGAGAAQFSSHRSGLLTGLPITGTLQNVGSLTGTIDIAGISLNNAGNLVVTGTITGSVLDAAGNVVQTLTDVAFTTTATLTGAATGACDILFLQLGPLDLDLLGLVVDLSQITLDVDAQRGPGRLLGNLLCALTGLLDGGPLAAIGAILDRINRLLG